MPRVLSVKETVKPQSAPNNWIEWFVTVVRHQQYDPTKDYGKLHYIQQDLDTRNYINRNQNNNR